MKQLPLYWIERKENSAMGFYEYIIYYIDPLREKGEAKFSLTSFCSGDTWDPAHYNLELMQILHDLGVSEGMYGIRLNMFYPNGSDYLNNLGSSREKPYEHMRQGMGTVLLETIIHDALELNAKFIYFESYESEMADFSIKHNFERIGSTDTFFKIL